ncbi:MAG: polymerase, sigma-24 subunit, subfamily [Bacteroidetes bacterium]|jgi:RNA polymerase sigma-70 factor (ECF subfamily)|nr:polymerase, sigma-24 subunit, subfamily [Bacteroidota bacterium]
MEELSDLQLIEEVRNGKRRAFTELMRRYQQRIYWAARRIVGTHEDADDIAQEAFVKAYTALGDFRGESSFYTWLYRIAINLSLNAIRKRQLVNYLRENDTIGRFFPSTEDPSRQVEFKETQSRLQEAIARLPEKQRAVFVMRYYDEMSYEEISEVMKTSVGGLKANYFHALRKVREYMTDEIPSGTSGHQRK